MNDYLKSTSNMDSPSKSTSFTSSFVDETSILEMPEQPPATTSSFMSEKESESLQDSAQYLSPQKIKLRKYTLKKG